MKIKCPQCSATNDVQKYCGNCGSKLLVDVTELNSKPNMESKTLNDKPIKKRNRWIVGIGLFLLIYLIGGIALELFIIYAGLDDRYASAISFVAGIIVAWHHIATNSEV